MPIREDIKMKVLIAVDSFEGSISSVNGSEAIYLGIKDVYPEDNTETASSRWWRRHG